MKNPIKTLFTVSLLTLSFSSFSNPAAMNTWISPVLGTSSIWELHMIKNDGMDTHVKYRCSHLSQCWHAYNEVKYRSSNFAYVKSVWFERLDKKIILVR